MRQIKTGKNRIVSGFIQPPGAIGIEVQILKPAKPGGKEYVLDVWDSEYISLTPAELRKIAAWAGTCQWMRKSK